eukprot:TRINITY_DN25630_c0_g1_i1.p1 TRINITY_DN25630_c0_g1~~TRINITY_DN25630_c0_g1_i1.p1  ORF type:complete len:279 (+),score=77.06 TRINITY_DN25630_c0_g1_i1:92-928(+)
MVLSGVSTASFVAKSSNRHATYLKHQPDHPTSPNVFMQLTGYGNEVFDYVSSSFDKVLADEIETMKTEFFGNAESVADVTLVIPKRHKRSKSKKKTFSEDVIDLLVEEASTFVGEPDASDIETAALTIFMKRILATLEAAIKAEKSWEMAGASLALCCFFAEGTVVAATNLGDISSVAATLLGVENTKLVEIPKAMSSDEMLEQFFGAPEVEGFSADSVLEMLNNAEDDDDDSDTEYDPDKDLSPNAEPIVKSSVAWRILHYPRVFRCHPPWKTPNLR